jgi:hypothetical protein
MAKKTSRSKTTKPSGKSARVSKSKPKPKPKPRPDISRKDFASSKTAQFLTSLRHAVGAGGKQGKSIPRADFADFAKKFNTTESTVKRNAGRYLKTNKDGSISVTATDSMTRVMEVFSAQGKRQVPIRGYKQAQEINRYIHAVEDLARARTSAERLAAINELERFEGKTISFGNRRVRLLTDPKQLMEILRREGPLKRYPTKR